MTEKSMREKIEAVINSNLSGYAIEKHCYIVSQNVISNLRNGKSKIGNITLNTCEELEKVYDDLLK